MVTIAHATALTPDDELPFDHAVALAHRAGATLCSVHASDDPRAAKEIPDANARLAAWGLEGQVTHERVVHTCCDDPVDTTLDALRKLDPDLVVVGTHQHEGILRLLRRSRAEAIAEHVDVPTLIVPVRGRGFVDGGRLQLQRVLVPVGDAEAARLGCERARWFVELAKTESGELALLHVGEGELAFDHAPPPPTGYTTSRLQADGPLEEVILEHARTADLVVMPTRGHDSITDVLVGSHTERVLHRAPCPVLSVPIPRS